jgi:hypothetical protein
MDKEKLKQWLNQNLHLEYIDTELRVVSKYRNIDMFIKDLLKYAENE